VARRVHIKDHHAEARLFARRAGLAALAATLALGAVAARLVQLQVLDHERYSTLSRENRVRLVPLPPPRGLIFDRNGVPVAENRPAYRLELVPEEITDLEGTLARLARIVDLRPLDIERFRALAARKPPFEAIPLRLRLSEAEAARFAVHRHEFPGVDITVRPARRYPAGPLLAHVLGYVARIDADDLEALDPVQYRGTSHVGKLGIERAYEPALHGQVGMQQVEVNAQGRALRVLERTPPRPGRSLWLSIDLRLQRVAQDALGEANGAVVAIDPRTGEVLALVSAPAYDPNLFVDGIDPDTYRALAHDPDRPLFNRALRGRYPPGSTIKPFMALAGLEYELIGPHTTRYCPGWFMLPIGERRYRDWKRDGHGVTDLRKAIAESCDVYFYDLAVRLGIDRIHGFLARFGFGAGTGLDVAEEAAGLLPSRAWKRRARGQPWFPGETVITGIGQGYLLVTPMELAAATATLATRGRRQRPHLVRAMAEPGAPPHPLAFAPVEPVRLARPDRWEAVVHAMEAVVHGRHGTARGIADAPYRIAGKTGTAQVFGLAEDQEYDPQTLAERLRDHALFIAFAPADAPRIAVAVIVENGGSGGAVAAPVARKVMDAWLLRDRAAQEEAGRGGGA